MVTGRILNKGIFWTIVAMVQQGEKNFIHARDVCPGIHSALKVGRKRHRYSRKVSLTHREFFSHLTFLPEGNEGSFCCLK
jgi:hypothetical protein